MHRFGEVGRRDVDVLPSPGSTCRARRSRNRRVGLETAGDEVLRIGQAEPIAADLHQFAGMNERLELPPESDTLLAGHPQEAGARGRWPDADGAL